MVYGFLKFYKNHQSQDYFWWDDRLFDQSDGKQINTNYIELDKPVKLILHFLISDELKQRRENLFLSYLK